MPAGRWSAPFLFLTRPGTPLPGARGPGAPSGPSPKARSPEPGLGPGSCWGSARRCPRARELERASHKQHAGRGWMPKTYANPPCSNAPWARPAKRRVSLFPGMQDLRHPSQGHLHEQRAHTAKGSRAGEERRTSKASIQNMLLRTNECRVQTHSPNSQILVCTMATAHVIAQDNLSQSSRNRQRHTCVMVPMMKEPVSLCSALTQNSATAQATTRFTTWHVSDN